MKVQATNPTLHYQIDGPEGAPWVVLAHGIATDMSMWSLVVERLRSDYRVLSFDTRGHGGSEAADGDYSLAMLGDDVLRLLDDLDIPAAHYAGVSLGGMIGLELVLKHPERLISMACCDARASAPASYRDAWMQRRAAVLAEGMEAMVAQSMERWFAPGFVEKHPDLAALMEAGIRKTSPAGYRGCAAALMQLDYFDRLGEISTPTLYLVGHEDKGAPPDVVWQMHLATPKSRFIEIADAGHISPIEQPHAVSAALSAFFSSSSSGGGDQ